MSHLYYDGNGIEYVDVCLWHWICITVLVTYTMKELHDKEMALNAANSKINSLEDIKIKNEDKLNSYRGTLRKLIREQKEGNINDKERWPTVS